MRLLFCAVCVLFGTTSRSQDPYLRQENLDVKKYVFRLALNDTTDIIAGEAAITILFKKKTEAFELDLVGESRGVGMQVQKILNEKTSLNFSHVSDRVRITLGIPAEPGQALTFLVQYKGQPKEGLIISKNKFGDRTFFGDNWPDRARHWLPCIDHPSDKARVDFVVEAPHLYQVVATGRQVEETNLPYQRKRTHWEELADVPTKVITIGVARFAVTQSGMVEGIPISTWVYPQNRDEGFSDFAIAGQIFDFFSGHIGPYSYEKLAHVQSKTRWGGLENASNIFYFENSVTGKNERESLIAHETAHQWFGNSVTENDWYHVWLSEGFATYFTHLYLEFTYGEDRRAGEMKGDRQQVIDYSKKVFSPIINTTYKDMNQVLSTNTYQKAAWVLHMLRKEIGDQAFWKGIRSYYGTYQNGNAMTADLQREMESASGMKLKDFFYRWLYLAGHPVLTGEWKFDDATKILTIQLQQVQTGTAFNIPIEVGVYEDLLSPPKIEKLRLDKFSGTFSFPLDKKPVKVVLDPHVNLLFEGGLKN